MVPVRRRRECGDELDARLRGRVGTSVQTLEGDEQARADAHVRTVVKAGFRVVHPTFRPTFTPARNSGAGSESR
jgi:hypothetical protein